MGRVRGPGVGDQGRVTVTVACAVSGSIGTSAVRNVLRCEGDPDRREGRGLQGAGGVIVADKHFGLS
jgi:hypothetical protein